MPPLTRVPAPVESQVHTCVLTLRLDPATQHHFDALRRRHFPPALNRIPAHLTLFHTLPGTPEIAADLALAAAHTPQFPIAVTGLRSLGRGVAYTIAAPPLLSLHAHLSAAFADHLTPQDRQRFQPHIVVQNKVTPESARALLDQLRKTFEPRDGQAMGLDLWTYLRGPWEHRQTFPFASPISPEPATPHPSAPS